MYWWNFYKYFYLKLPSYTSTISLHTYKLTTDFPIYLKLLRIIFVYYISSFTTIMISTYFTIIFTLYSYLHWHEETLLSFIYNVYCIWMCIYGCQLYIWCHAFYIVAIFLTWIEMLLTYLIILSLITHILGIPEWLCSKYSISKSPGQKYNKFYADTQAKAKLCYMYYICFYFCSDIMIVSGNLLYFFSFC